MYTKKEILDLAENKKALMLIKAHRETFGSSLRDAKDAVFSTLNDLGDRDKGFNKDKLLELFNMTGEARKTLSAVKILVDNYELLGYESIKEALTDYCDRL